MSIPPGFPPPTGGEMGRKHAKDTGLTSLRHLFTQPVQRAGNAAKGAAKLPAPSGGGPVLSAVHYTDPGTSTATSYQANPSSLYYFDWDDPTPYVSYVGAGTGAPGLKMLVDGGYQVYAYAQISGLTTGDNAQMTVQWPSAGFDLHDFTESNSNDYALQCASVPSLNVAASGTGLVTVHIDNPAGGTINSVLVSVLKLRD